MQRVPGPVDDRLRAARPRSGRWSRAGRRRTGTAAGRADRARSRTSPARPGPVWRAKSWSPRTGRGAAAAGDWGASRPSRYKRTEGRASERLRRHRDSAAERCRPNPIRDGRMTVPVRPEPGGIGTAGARDPLAREVSLLGALLGQVDRRAGRTRVVRPRRAHPPAQRSAFGQRGSRRTTAPRRGSRRTSTWARPRPSSARSPCTSSSSNLAEERHASGRCDAGSGRPGWRARRLDRRGHRATARRSAGRTPTSTRRSARSSITPVLTAHPTEARRRTLLVALRRCGDLLARLDDPRLTPDEDADVRRRLREEITPAVADRRPAPDRARTARRGPDGDRLLRRDAVHASPHVWPGCSTVRSTRRPAGAAAGAGVGGRGRPGGPGRDRPVSAVPALGQLDRRRPRRQPERDRRHDRADAPDPRRPRPPRVTRRSRRG